MGWQQPPQHFFAPKCMNDTAECRDFLIFAISAAPFQSRTLKDEPSLVESPSSQRRLVTHKIDSAHVSPHHLRFVVRINLQQQFPILCARVEPSLLAGLISALVTAIKTLRNQMRFELRIALHAVGVAADTVNAARCGLFEACLEIVVGFALL